MISVLKKKIHTYRPTLLNKIIITSHYLMLLASETTTLSKSRLATCGGAKYCGTALAWNCRLGMRENC